MIFFKPTNSQNHLFPIRMIFILLFLSILVTFYTKYEQTTELNFLQ